jgi:hypothetical protein
MSHQKVHYDRSGCGTNYQRVAGYLNHWSTATLQSDENLMSGVSLPNAAILMNGVIRLIDSSDSSGSNRLSVHLSLCMNEILLMIPRMEWMFAGPWNSCCRSCTNCSSSETYWIA